MCCGSSQSSKNTPILNVEHKKFFEFIASSSEDGGSGEVDTSPFTGIHEPTEFSNTTTAILTCLFFHLARDPQVVEALLKEVDDHFRFHGDRLMLYHWESWLILIRSSTRLSARIHRSRFICYSGTNVSLHMQMNFIPERFTSRKEMTKNPSAFITFPYRRYSYVDKQLGLMKIR
ncbi:hypothetical protein K432DRAFT_398231 [Lepidopterella palustris CBS 459.81]|uniref:Cytochrome P450 n=1 Tax=Lepidopterella palustris CBS 459.81 TaxID=1314670 RepID=A0A8E2J9I1_9PEZI|nr:hypothetical protein K432DRAFT_398231 [Lepidopterella palustris CBS 459.81]